MSFSDLPLTFDLLRSHTCEVSQGGAPCTCFTSAAEESKPPAIDKRLRHWNEWMGKRKEMHQKLGQLLRRAPGSLLMNATEELRTVKEKKLAFDYAKIPEPDLQRGCPGFWKLPTALKNECGEEVYFSNEKKEDRCEIPVIEHVGLPTLTLEEKDVLPRTRNSLVLWEKSGYVQEKSAKLTKTMRQVDPYKPEFDDLCIKGVSLNKLAEKPTKLTFSETTKTATDETRPNTQSPSVLSLSINDFQLRPNMEGTRKVYVLFDYDINSKKVSTEHLALQNTGTTTIRFSWKSVEKTEFFHDLIPDKPQEINFNFNKNQDLIIPGQTIQFPIWFKTDQPGTYCEHWYFCTKPRIGSANACLVVVLHASAEFGDLSTKMEAIQDELDRKVRNRLIHESLSTVLAGISYDKFKPTVYSYNKREVFETINSHLDPVHRQPKYLYNKEVVRELQKFYKRVRQSSDPKVWNYHMEELRILARVKQRQVEQSAKLSQQEEAGRTLGERPKFPGLACDKTVFPHYVDDHQQVRNKEPIVKITEITKSDEQPLTEQLEAIISKLECPAVEKNLAQTKYAQAYLILCTCFSRTNGEFEDLKVRLGIVKNTRYPKMTNLRTHQPDRLIHERLHDVLEGPSLVVHSGTKMDRPAAESIQKIPAEDTKRRYRAYYNLPDTPPPESAKSGRKGKGGKAAKKDKKPEKKGGGKNDKKSGKDDKKSGKGKKNPKAKTEDKKQPDEEDDGYLVNEDFDPYANITLQPIHYEMEEAFNNDADDESNFSTLPPAILRQYKYNLYIIMYNNLDKAITNVIDMIEMQPNDHLPYAVIKEIEEPKYTRRLIDLKSLLAEETAHKLKSKLLLYKYRKESKKDWRTIELQRQLRGVRSDSSLWSVLRPDEPKPKLVEDQPISYPQEHYDDVKKTSVRYRDFEEADPEDRGANESEEPSPLKVDMSTSTLQGGVLDPAWEDFKDAVVQKDYGEDDEPDDLQAYIEKVVGEVSMQDLFDIKVNKATQKKTEDHVSDEEYFYGSSSDDDFGALSGTDFSLDSEQNEESCSACSLSIHEKLNGEEVGVCNMSLDQVDDDSVTSSEFAQNTETNTCTCGFFRACNTSSQKVCPVCRKDVNGASEDPEKQPCSIAVKQDSKNTM